MTMQSRCAVRHSAFPTLPHSNSSAGPALRARWALRTIAGVAAERLRHALAQFVRLGDSRGLDAQRPRKADVIDFRRGEVKPSNCPFFAAGRSMLSSAHLENLILGVVGDHERDRNLYCAADHRP